MEIRPGIFINDRYEIIEKVGSGGMADVYKAKCHRLDRYVAIKVLKSEYSDDKKFVAKFRAEAQSAARLSHPNVVNVYDVGEEDGIYFIVMELVEGITLKSFIERKGKLDTKEAVGVAIQIAQGMEAAHSNHIIHRDIKPQNIIISREGKVKVTDFGIAKMATSETITSNAMGSVHYISPEQARGGFSDERSDIYSLGITMYEMLTGRVPFSGDNTVSVALLHLQEEPLPMRELEPGIPISLDRIVQKCLQKKQERRYQSASELISDLKMSLSHPNGEFVRIAPAAIVADSPTINISDGDLDQIKSATRSTNYAQNIGRDEKEFYEEEEPRRVRKEKRQERYDYDDIEEQEPRRTRKDRRQERYDYDDIEEQEPRRTRKDRRQERYDYDDIEDEIEKDDDDEEVDPKLAKFMVAGGVIAAIIIVILVVIIIGRWSGLLGKSKDNTLDRTTEPTATIEATKTPEKASPTPEAEKLPVPKVVGMELENALETLEKTWNVRYTQESSDTFGAGIVIRQDVQEGTELEAGSRINLVVSTGRASVSLMDVYGYSATEAKNLLQDAGYVVKHDYEYNDNVAKDIVIRTSPEKGSSVKKGDSITIVVSRGAEEKYADIPDLSGMSETAARQALEKIGLNAGTISYAYHDTVEKGKVISQTYTVGKSVKEGTEVGFTVSLGQEEKKVYKYYGSVTINYNPFDYEDETGTIVLKLIQDGHTKTIYSSACSMGDFPLTVSNIEGYSESNGEVRMYLDGVEVGDTYSVSFSKVEQ